MEKVIAEIAAERRRQIDGEGWTPEHDDQHFAGEMARAAAAYAVNASVPEIYTAMLAASPAPGEDVVERVAEGLADKRLGRGMWEKLSDVNRNLYREDARAVIAALEGNDG